jgi:phospholipid/cholesterol/gamma-HCH transport system permease protein
VSVASPLGGRFTGAARNVAGTWNRVGEQTQFYGRTLLGIQQVFLHYKAELVRTFAQMSLGIGALALIGGTIVVTAFLLSQVGSLIAIQIYGSLANIGVEALTGFGSAYISTRFSTPIVTGVALAATIGASTTAQLGAQRINEEIDALESISVNTIAYLCSTRVVAGIALAVPLGAVALLSSYAATQIGVTLLYGQSVGVYDHYFETFLNPLDVMFALLQTLVMGLLVMLIHTYYGYNASGGPAGVGEAVGRAVRASLVSATAVNLAIAMALYGQSGGFNLSG